eukprot:749303-Hanusia_phi.AAC.4
MFGSPAALPDQTQEECAADGRLILAVRTVRDDEDVNMYLVPPCMPACPSFVFLRSSMRSTSDFPSLSSHVPLVTSFSGSKMNTKSGRTSHIPSVQEATSLSLVHTFQTSSSPTCLELSPAT